MKPSSLAILIHCTSVSLMNAIDKKTYSNCITHALIVYVASQTIALPNLNDIYKKCAEKRSLNLF